MLLDEKTQQWIELLKLAPPKKCGVSAFGDLLPWVCLELVVTCDSLRAATRNSASAIWVACLRKLNMHLSYFARSAIFLA